MANGFQASLEPLVFDNQGDASLSLPTIPEKQTLTDLPLSKEDELSYPPVSKEHEFSESSSPVPEKKSWFGRKKKDKSEKKEESYPAVNPVKIFKFASVTEILLMCVGLLAGLIQGGAFPFIFLSIGEVIDSFFKFQTTASGCSTNFFANSSSDTCSASLLADTTSFIPFVNGSVVANASWFFCTADIQGYALNIPALSALTTNVIDRYCSSPQFYSAFSDRGGCCSDYERCISIERASLYDSVLMCNVLLLAAIGFLVAICSYVQTTIFVSVSESITYKIRVAFFKSLLRQDIAWFDEHAPGKLTTRLTEDLDKIKDGIGEKLVSVLRSFAGVIVALVLSFLKCWALVLIVVFSSVVVLIPFIFLGKADAHFSAKESAAYASAGGIAEEVLGALRTVIAFGGQNHELKRYGDKLDRAKKYGLYRGMAIGSALFFLFTIIYSVEAVAFGIAKVFSSECLCDFGDSLTVVFLVIISVFVFGQGANHLTAIQGASGAAGFVFHVLKRTPDIDVEQEGAEPQDFVGEIEFKGVRFNYPTRKEVPVLRGVDLEMRPGQIFALVGPSGCGKSTVLSLIQRFYTPNEGEILIGGRPIQEYSLRWLRQRIGIVSQEPVLFGISIADNIRIAKPDATQEEIETATKAANAHEFVSNLPQGYDTLVGDRGAQLSGGQKQRIAIARAMISDPQILLLDEATSALDNQSEALVQEAIDNVAHGRTIIIVAHRLSTIKKADQILAFSEGAIGEQGTHQELMKRQGIYYQLVVSQTYGFTKDDTLNPTLSNPKSQMGDYVRTLSAVSNKSAETPTAKPAETAAPSKDDEEMDDGGFDPKVSGSDWKLLFRALKLNLPEWWLILFGVIAAGISGLVFPSFALIFIFLIDEFSSLYVEGIKNNCTYIYSVLNMCQGDFSIQIPTECLQAGGNDVVFFLVIALFSGLGLASGTLIFIRSIVFTVSAERLTKRIRELTFKSIMKQDVKFFDNPKRSVGRLLVRLSTDSVQVSGITGIRIGVYVEMIISIVCGTIISFVFGWPVACLIILFIPLMVAVFIIRNKLASGKAIVRIEAYEHATKIAVESLENIRTVQIFTAESRFSHQYATVLKKPLARAYLGAQFYGLGSSIADGLQYWAYALVFAFGTYLTTICPCNPAQLTINRLLGSFFGIFLGAAGAANANGFAPDLEKAKRSARRIFALVDARPTMESDATKSGVENPRGGVSFSNVKYRYESRPNVEVLEGLNLELEPGKTLALVGPSGCGKSTIVSLILRFYDPDEGVVRIDGTDITTLDTAALRRECGIVFQEPILFDTSVADNIKYGALHREVSMEEVHEAAKKANIHDFISSLPNGYDTRVGEKGTQMSGGEKQRIAIARALLRDPKILLLDEATSALDAESEGIVQAALDKAKLGRSTVMIAHRLSTIVDSDKIAVINDGRVVEIGSHDWLVSMKGVYHKLWLATQGITVEESAAV